MNVGKFAILLAVLLFAIFSNSIFSSSFSLPPPYNTTIQPSPLFSVLALSFMLSFLVIAIGVIISKVVPGTNLSEWLKNEYWEMAKSAILIAGSVGFLVFAGNLSLLLINQKPLTQYGLTGVATSLNTLSTSAFEAINTILGNLFNSELGSNLFGLVQGIGTLKSINLGWWVPLPLEYGAFTFGTKFNLYTNPMLESSSSGQFESIINDTLNFIFVPVTILFFAIGVLLPMIVFVGFMILVPIGIIFRAFPFLRPIGGTLYAFGIGLSIIFPLLIILLNLPVSNLIFSLLTPPATQSTTYLSGIINILIDSLATTVSFAANPALYIGATVSIYPALNNLVPFFIYLFLQLALFVVDLIIWFPITDSIAKALGGTIRLDIGGRIKIG
ncbi:MAG: hypothetical protein ACP5RT_00815 [Candidatus Micrarchaeia archaeon]